MSRQHRTRYYRKGWTIKNLNQVIKDVLEEHAISNREIIIYTGVEGSKNWKKCVNKYKNAPKRKEVLEKNRKHRWTKKTREKYKAIQLEALREKERLLLNQNII